MDEIPPLTPPTDLQPIRTQEELHRHWRMLMGPLGFGGRSLWVHLLDGHGRPTPALVQIEDLLPVPDPAMRENFAGFLRHLVSDVDGSSVAFLLTRPGCAGITVGDRRWAQMLSQVSRQVGSRAWPVHRANDDELVVVAPDDLAATA